MLCASSIESMRVARMISNVSRYIDHIIRYIYPTFVKEESIFLRLKYFDLRYVRPGQ